jgi:hypothetical protein
LNPIMPAADDYKEEGDGWEQVRDLFGKFISY